jgi:hypothetical protein
MVMYGMLALPNVTGVLAESFNPKKYRIVLKTGIRMLSADGTCL